MKPEKKYISETKLDALLQTRQSPKIPTNLTSNIQNIALTTPQQVHQPVYLSLWSEATYVLQSCFSLSPSKVALPVLLIGILIGGFSNSQVPKNSSFENYYNQTYQYGYTP